MQKYLPIDIGINIHASGSDMLAFRWNDRGVVADFGIPGDDHHIIRVIFSRTIVVRILDEMELSTEEPLGEGLIKNHFAYRVLGAKFWNSQSKALTEVRKSAEHYRFITG